MKAKYKVGDTVKILDGRHIPRYAGGWNMSDDVGKIATIEKIVYIVNPIIGYQLKGLDYIYDERGLEIVNGASITIISEDNKVIATDNLTGETAIARCNPEDQFDLCVGAKLALDRLIEKTKEPEYLNTKIIFVKGDRVFKTGHIYEVKNGKIIRPDNGKTLPSFRNKFETLYDIKDYFTSSMCRKNCNGWSSDTLEFIEVKED